MQRRGKHQLKEPWQLKRPVSFNGLRVKHGRREAQPNGRWSASRRRRRRRASSVAAAQCEPRRIIRGSYVRECAPRSKGCEGEETSERPTVRRGRKGWRRELCDGSIGGTLQWCACEYMNQWLSEGSSDDASHPRRERDAGRGRRAPIPPGPSA